MVRTRLLRLFFVTFGGGALAVGGCSAIFGEDFRVFMSDTARGTAVAVGQFLVEAAVDAAFD